jgi:hypothetical protein
VFAPEEKQLKYIKRGKKTGESASVYFGKQAYFAKGRYYRISFASTQDGSSELREGIYSGARLLILPPEKWPVVQKDENGEVITNLTNYLVIGDTVPYQTGGLASVFVW